MGTARAERATLERHHKAMGKTDMKSVTKTTKGKLAARQAPAISKDESGSLIVQVAHDDALKDLFGMKTRAAAKGVFLTGMLSLGTRGVDYSEMLASMAIEMEPKDAVEAMLINQMAPTHVALAWATQQMVDAQNLQRVEAFDRMATRLARTFTTQVEALKRYRAKAQQIVRVERVEVREGGQAIVGDVTHHAGEGR